MNENKHLPGIRNDQYDERNPIVNEQRDFNMTIEQFKKYTVIEADRKKSQHYFMKNNSQSNSKNESWDTNQEKVIPANNKSVKNMKKDTKKSFSFMPNPKLQRMYFQDSHINDVITIVESDQQLMKSNDITIGKGKNEPSYDITEKKNNRSISLKAYLDKKQKKEEGNLLFLPKIGKTEALIHVMQQELKQSRQNKGRKSGKKKGTINHHTIDHHRNQQHLPYQPSQKYNHPLQTQAIHDPTNRNFIRPLLPSPTKLNSINRPERSQSFSTKKRKIELFGLKFHPIDRIQSRLNNEIQQLRPQRIARNLLSSELIYKNQKQDIQKSVYQQLSKRMFSFN